jgi:hypothetical protein
MKVFFIFTLSTLLLGCGGSISDEQRQKYKEGMEQQKIVHATDAEILAEALTLGQTVFKQIGTTQFDSLKIDSLEKAHKVSIRFLVPGSSNALAIEQELIDAYINGLTVGSGTQENLQKLWKDDQKRQYDSILYSKPQLLKRADGVEELQGIWSISMARKNVVINIGRKQ